jgi:hypothetical protein
MLDLGPAAVADDLGQHLGAGHRGSSHGHRSCSLSHCDKEHVLERDLEPDLGGKLRHLDEPSAGPGTGALHLHNAYMISLSL